MSVKKLSPLAVAVVLCGIVSSASASLLPLGGTILTPGEVDPVGGTVLATTGAVAITTPTYTGTLTSTVISGDTSNPFGPGSLTFTYLIHNDSTSPDDIDRMTVSSFLGFSTDVSYQTPAGGSVVPSISTRDLAGDVVGFSFVGIPLGFGVLTPGSNSALLVIQTNATVYSVSNAFTIDGSVGTVSSYAPAPGGGTNTPEPASLSIAALGGAALLLRRRRANG